MPDAVYLGNSEGINLCNSNALRMLGATSLRDLNARIGDLGKTFSVRWPESGRELREDKLQFSRALRGETVIEEVLAKNRKTGADVFIRSACAPVREGAPSSARWRSTPTSQPRNARRRRCNKAKNGCACRWRRRL